MVNQHAREAGNGSGPKEYLHLTATSSTRKKETTARAATSATLGAGQPQARGSRPRQSALRACLGRDRLLTPNWRPCSPKTITYLARSGPLSISSISKSQKLHQQAALPRDQRASYQLKD